MKKSRFYILALILFFVGTISAQDLPNVNQVSLRDGRAAIMVEVPANSPLTRFSLRDEIRKTSISADVPGNRVVSFIVVLSEGENKFKLFGYESNGDAAYSTDFPIVFKRAGDKTEAVNSQKEEKPTEKTKKLELFPQKIEKGKEATLRFNVPDGVSLFDPTKNEPRKLIVEIENGDKKSSEEYDIALEKGKDDKPLSPNKPLVQQQVKLDLREGTSLVTIYPKGKKELAAQTKIVCDPCKAVDDEPGRQAQSRNFRAVVGVQQVGASSANSEQHPFLNIFIRTPVGRRGFAVWGDIGLTPTTIQNVAALSNLTNTLTATTESKPNNIVSGFDFLIGFEQRISRRDSDLFGGVFPGRSSLYAIVSFGAILPLSTDRSTAFYKIPRVNNGMDIDPRFLALFPDAAGKTNIAFVTPDRSRFFRQYYAGLRLKTFFFEDDKTTPKEMFPAMLDLTFGQNEAITNRAQGVILRFDGSMPLPIRNNEFLYLFGGVQMKLGKNVNQQIPPFFLEAATNVSLSSADTLIVPIDQSPFLRSNRDIFRIGIGIDIFKIFTRDENK